MHFTHHYNPNALKPVHCFPWYTQCYTNATPSPTYLPPHAPTLAIETMIVTRWLLLFVCYSTVLDSTDIFTSGKSKTSISINGIEVYTKEQLVAEIQRFIVINVQLMTDKMKTEKTKVNLKVDRVRLLGEKNSLVVKREKLRAKIVIMNAVRSSNVSIHGQ